jgi:NADH-quinone oxidoreductase subunit J
MTQVIDQFLFYGLLVLGAVGVGLALPRKGVNPQPLGAILAASAGGAVILALSAKAGWDHLPNIYFYIFAVVALGAALRVITHPRPVYAALFFILTILASSGLYVLLAAEFMAFALIIVYAGAILITYLFVIMLATQAPSEDQPEALADYDRSAREPIVGTAVGFLMLGVLTTMVFKGVTALPAPASRTAGVPGTSDALLAMLPGKVERELRRPRAVESPGWHDGDDGPRFQWIPLMRADERLATRPDGTPELDWTRRIAVAQDDAGQRREVAWPKNLAATNIEGVGRALLADHPGAIEIAGVILLMAMLGAVVLARKQVDLDDDAKAKRVMELAKARVGEGGGGLGVPGVHAEVQSEEMLGAVGAGGGRR